MIEPAPEDEDARVAWRRRQLARLTAIGMEIAEALGAKAKAEGELPFDPGLAFGRLARAVRLTLALDEKMGRAACERSAAAEMLRIRRAHDQVVIRAGQRRDEAYALIEQAVEAEADRAEARGEAFEAEELLAEARERLDDDEAEDFDWRGDQPVAEIAAVICRDLGVPFEADGWMAGVTAGTAAPEPAATGPP